MHVYSATDTIFKHHGFEDGNHWNHSVQYKQNIVERDTFPANSGFEAIYHFNIQSSVNMDSLRAVVERPELWKVLANGEELQKGTVAIVKVNGEQAGILSSPPYVRDISKLVREGDNKVEVVVIGSLKILWGLYDFGIIRSTD